MYREELGPHEETDVGMNLGGGAKITLVGPLKARLDYRVFKLAGGALNSPAHRFYAGLTSGSDGRRYFEVQHQRQVDEFWLT